MDPATARSVAARARTENFPVASLIFPRALLPHLRATYSVPFVGTVPAIKPACAASKTKRVSVLGTRGTVKREYTRKLIDDFSQGCEVTLVGSLELASLAEAALSGNEVSDAAIAADADYLIGTGGGTSPQGLLNYAQSANDAPAIDIVAVRNVFNAAIRRVPQDGRLPSFLGVSRFGADDRDQ